MRATQRGTAMAVMGLIGGLAPATAAGQEEAMVCPAGKVVVGDLGYTGLECTNCTMLVGSPDQRVWIFRSEPVVLSAKRLPDSEELQAGDVITTIDGVLITTKEGGRRFANVVPGTPTRIGVRRDGRELTLTVTPGASCDALRYAEPMVDAAPAAPAPPKAAAPAAVPRPAVVADALPAPAAAPLPPPPPKAAPRGQLGFSISCTACKVHITDGDGAPRWVFSEPPVVERIEVSGPAAGAGLRGGDVLTHIDGVALTTEAGGERFGAVEPGDTVTFRFVRNARGGEVRIVAQERPWTTVPVPAPRAAAPAVVARGVPLVAAAPEPTRFSGVLGDAHVVVSGGPINVTRTDTEIVIRSQDITVRISSVGRDPQPK